MRCFLLLVLLAPAVVAAQAPPAHSKGSVFHQKVYSLSGQFQARLDVGPDTAELATPSDTVRMSRGAFNGFVRDYVAQNGTLIKPPHLSIGQVGRDFIFAIRQPMWAAFLAFLVALIVGPTVWLFRRARRRIRLLHEAQAQLLLRRRIVEAGREEERQRLARELHDGPLQTLYALRMQMARRDADRQQQDALVAEATEHLRTVLDVLRSPLLAPYGLHEALQNFGATYPGCTFDVDLATEPEQALSHPTRNAVFRILQEAVSNAVRHGHATQVTIALHMPLPQQATLTITDNGRGFDASVPLDARARQGHYGLVGMRERVDVLGGTLHLASTPEGTTLTVRLPLPERRLAGDGGSSTHGVEVS